MSISFFAFLMDCIIGDPRSGWHPVVLIGKWIAALEKVLYRAEDSNTGKLVKGGIVVVLVLAAAWGISNGIIQAAFSLNFYLGNIVEALLLSFMISPRSLSEAGMEIRNYLLEGNLEQARFKVGWIVGRDTDKLTPGEVTRATVETVAENLVDGVISPLFFFWLGGVPLAVLYRAANTMDSMLGYKNDKYLYFGRTAARLDDVLNWIPARITGVLVILAALILRLDARNAMHIMQRDAGKHPSPNGGYPESSVAGALNIQLGGVNYYFGQKHFRAYMGDARQALGPQHITDTVRIMYTVTILFLCLFSIGTIWGGR